MKWILNANKRYKLPYFISNIMLIFFDSVNFIVPIVIGKLVDSVLVNKNYNELLYTSIFLIIFVVVKYLGAYFSVIWLNNTCLRITSNIKSMCYEKLNSLDYNFFEKNNRGELMTNFTSDINRIQEHFSYTIKTIGAISIIFICSLLYLLSINIPFTLILLLPGFIIGYISYRFLKKISPEYEKLRNLTSNSNDFISDNIEANRVVKSFAIEEYEIEQMKKINTKYRDEDIRIGKIENRFYQKVDFCSYLMNVIFLIGGGYLFIHGKITIGNLIIFNFYLYQLRQPFTRLSNLLNKIERYKIARKRIEKILSSEPKVKLLGKEPINNLLVPIEFKNVSISYDKNIVASNLNIKIQPYQTIAFIGKTGSGKSSIVNALLGFVTPLEGQILINGKNYLDYDIKDIRYHIGYVTQNPFLFSDTIYNNISYGNQDISKTEAGIYGKIAECNYIEKLPEKLDTIIGERGVGLSGGEKQRLSLARALAVQPDILLLDDITSALDIDTEERINKSLNDLEYKSTKIIIASKIVSVMNADKIYVLDSGKIIEEGTHQELLSKKGYYYDLYKTERGNI